MKVLAVWAHPDGIEFGCGGLTRALRRGHNEFVFGLAEGGASGCLRDGTGEFERSTKFMGGTGIRNDGFEDIDFPAGRGETLHLAWG
jgi:LmbE family N-acetylglucosaminyl deacetylase